MKKICSSFSTNPEAAWSADDTVQGPGENSSGYKTVSHFERRRNTGWKVLLPQEIKEDARQLLISNGLELIDGRGFEPEDVKADMLKYKPEAMIVRITPINRDIIECNPNLKVIVRHGAGFDALDIKACRMQGGELERESAPTVQVEYFTH